MKRLHFKLTLEPGLKAIVRLAQLHQYATDLVDGERSILSIVFNLSDASITVRITL